MRSPFGQLLADSLEKRGLRPGAFARLVKLNPSVISRAISGKHVPRVYRGPQWATVLELNEAETRAFIEALELANSPPGVQRLVRRLRARIDQLERRNQP